MKKAAEEYPVILRVLVGSRAHGVADEMSDYDYREVFVTPTRDLLSIPRSARPKSAWGASSRHTDDEAGWEIEPFLEMCLRCHPNAIELLAGPIETSTADGDSLRALLPHVVSRQAAAGSMLGYAKNARGKLLDRDQLVRMPKWAATYIRILWQGMMLLQTGALVIDLRERDVWQHVMNARGGLLAPHEALEIAAPWEQYLVDVRDGKTECVLPELPNIEAVNEWLLDLRRRHWEE